MTNAEKVTTTFEYRVVWQAHPRNYHPERVVFVIAEFTDDAKKLARDFIERTYGVVALTIHSATVCPVLPPGSVRGAT